jgi:membrane fusion protein (multidrug efflux system)
MVPSTFIRRLSFFSLMLFSAMILLSGCGSQNPKGGVQAVEVKAMQVIKRDTPVTYGFVGQVIAKDEVQIRAKVSGNIVAKMVAGGATVQEGQPLFQIDRRQYEASLLSAQAQVAQSQSTLSQARRDRERYERLASQGAVAQQLLDNAVTTEQQNESVVDANQAKAALAADDLSDTLIVSPLSGRIDVKDLSLGSFVQAGSTVLATVSSVDPIFVQFSMSENEYLQFAKLDRGASPAEWFGDLTLILSDGSKYPLTGKVEQVDRGMAQSTGTLTLKATFSNPQRLLVPGMFARVTAQAEIRKGALLIPQRAVQQILGKTFVTVIGEGDKAESRPVRMGAQIGSWWMVEEGLTVDDRVVVDGFQKAQPGTPLKVTMLPPDDPQALDKN